MPGPITCRLSASLIAAAAALAATGLAMTGVPSALADPATPTPVPATATPTPTATMSGGAAQAAGTADATTTGTSAAGTSAAGTAASGDILDQLAQEYAVGAGGGQLSNLLKTTLKLRAMGFRPSKANLDEITQSLNYRPNQMPLIAALKDTIAYQQKIKAQMEILQQYQQQQAGSAVMGAGQMPADSNPAQLPGVSMPAAPAAPAAPTP